MASNDNRLPELQEELRAATGEVNRLLKEAVEQPGRIVDPEQFWEALEKATVARQAVARYGNE
jgi:hypothetical protein